MNHLETAHKKQGIELTRLSEQLALSSKKLATKRARIDRANNKIAELSAELTAAQMEVTRLNADKNRLSGQLSNSHFSEVPTVVLSTALSILLERIKSDSSDSYTQVVHQAGESNKMDILLAIDTNVAKACASQARHLVQAARGPVTK